MKRLGLWVFLLFISVNQFVAYSQNDTTLQEKPVFGRQAKLISYILEGSHYRKLPLNDSLSSAIFDAYLSTLDNSRSFFLASDIASFEKYRNQIDDLTKNENVSAAYLNVSTEYKKLGIQIGLRAEQTHSIGNSITKNQLVDRKYIEFFPSVSLSRTLDKNNQLGFSYSRRIDRPDQVGADDRDLQ